MRELTKTGKNFILMTTESHQRALFRGVSWLDMPGRKVLWAQVKGRLQ